MQRITSILVQALRFGNTTNDKLKKYTLPPVSTPKTFYMPRPIIGDVPITYQQQKDTYNATRPGTPLIIKSTGSRNTF